MRQLTRWHDLRIAVLAICGVLATSAATHAATLMVNGDTPAVRLQRIADNSLVPTYPGVVIVHTGNCPGLDPESTLGCVSSNNPPEMWLAPGRADNQELRDVEMHELGHIFDLNEMTDADRSRFMGITHTPVVSWTDWIPYVAAQPIEQFADAYRLCARYPRITAAVMTRHATIGWDLDGRRASGQARAICALIREVAQRLS